MKLAEESRYLTTFATPFGIFYWLRMTIGISPTPEGFQHKINEVLEGLPGRYIMAVDVHDHKRE